MSEESWPKVGASMGIVAAVLLVLSLVFGPGSSPPGFNDSAAEIQAFLRDNHGEIQAAVAFQFGAIVAFAWFLGSIFYRLRPAEPAARLSVAALAGGVLLALGIRGRAVPDLVRFYSVIVAIYAFVVGVVGSFSETGAFSPSDGALGLIALLAFLVWLLAMGLTLVREPRPAVSPGAP